MRDHIGHRWMRRMHEGDGMREDGLRHGPGHRGGRRRMFDAGALRLTLLLLLQDQPRHGYDFIRALEERTGGAYAPSPGIVYPTLTLLQDLGHIAETTIEGAKRLFSITSAGRAHLDAHRAEAEAALARLDALGAENSRTESGPVWRAMQNLKLVLHQRLAGEQDKQAAFDIAALIDEAAHKIERL
jgi:DNA-binding PadR family transcriptional regulator